ncbi:hypothetical protein QZH41_014904, partial [Actinostola sp. cb2023]
MERQSRAFLPKARAFSCEELRDVNNWRPITLGSVLLRLYTKLWASRISVSIPINPRQRAFVPSDGCAESVLLLAALIDDAWRRKTNINLAWLDLAKAFDTVPHSTILRALRRKGVPEFFVQVVRDLYHGSMTRVTEGTDHEYHLY